MASTVKRLSMALLGAALMAFVSAHGATPSTHAALLDSDGDGVIDQAETVFGSNPNDAASTPEIGGSFSSLLVPGPDRCTDGIDNDRDGLIDSADPDCTDTDGDGIPDPVEQMLGSDPLDDSSIPEDARFDNILIASIFPYQLCNDSRDDDRDGLIDAADPGCNPIDSDGDGFADIDEKSLGSDWLDAVSVPEHATANPGSCADGIDNDHDGMIDAADPGCVTLTNDSVSDATVVSSLPFDDATKSLGATTESGEPTPSCAFEGIEGTVWYSFTASSDTPVVIDTSGSDFAALVGVWTRDQFGYPEVACNNPFFINPSARFAFQAVHGVTYLIQVGRNSALYPGAGKLTFHMEATTRPSNDDFADAADISAIPSSYTVDVVAATTEYHERQSSCAGGPVLNTVWYRYTPTADTYVLADTTGSTMSNVLAVYQGQAVDSLTQIACGWPYLPNPGVELAFLAKAGQTYYFQAGPVGFSDSGRPSAAGGGLPTTGTTIALNLRVFDVPSCPPLQFSIPDRIGDQSHDPTHPDILSISGAFASDRLCLTVQLDRERSLGSWDSDIEFDTDQNPSTGYNDLFCRRPKGLGIDTLFVERPSEGLLMPSNALRPGEHAVALVNGASYSMILPLDALGGDDRLSFAANVLGEGIGSDCAPDGGRVSCGDGTCSFSPFHNGDANCDGPADPIDAAVVLQLSVGLVASVDCPDAADVNGDGLIDSLDALLILQYSSGLLDQLPPEAPPPGPPF